MGFILSAEIIKIYVLNKSEFLDAKYIPVLLTMEVERREVCLECLLMNSLAH